MNGVVAGWHEAAAERLMDTARCPSCDEAELVRGRCPGCGADVSGAAGVELWHASVDAATALRVRAEVLLRVPRFAGSAIAGASAGASSPPPFPQALSAGHAPPIPPGVHRVATQPVDVVQAQDAPPRPSLAPPVAQRSATLQSVLVTAGAALFAVAAVVFTYFNPDLADRALRSVIVGLITLLFLGAAWSLARRRLRFSAEAVGGLGLVFAALDVHAVAQLGEPALHPWLSAAMATAVAAGVMLAAAVRSGIRIWMWASLTALAVVPAMLGYATETALFVTTGHLAVAFTGAGILALLPRLGALVSLAPERGTLIALQVLASASAMMLMWGIPAVDPALFRFALSGILTLVTVHAVTATHRSLPRLWSFVAGAAGVAAVTFTVFGVGIGVSPRGLWDVAILATGAAIGLVLIGGALPLPPSAARRQVAAGALAVLGGLTLVPLSYALGSAPLTVFAVLQGAGRGTPGQPASFTASPWDWSVLVGLGAVSAGLGLFGVVARRRPELRGVGPVTDSVSLVIGIVAVLTLGCRQLLPLAGTLSMLLLGAAVAALALRFVPRVATARASLRAPLLAGAHLALAAAAMIAWSDPPLVPLAGVLILCALVVVATASPHVLRFAHVAVGFAYALIILATFLAQVGVTGIALLCLTASAGLAVAIVATHLRAVGARAWQAVLAVAVVPFGIGVVQVVFERSGWTALSTGLMLVLSLSLLVTRRPGLTPLLRIGAAALLVPSLAVVVVCLGAQLLATSASPVTLPIIAGIVALVLPNTTRIGDLLAARGLGPREVSAGRVAIEVSALLTAAIAVGLALVREASGLGTTCLVLLILGIGAVATALSTRRRYAWWVAGASFTGALWCVWGLADVTMIEAYLLPPALTAAVVAVALTGHGIRAVTLYTAGLIAAVVPVLVLAALDAPGPWRALALLAAAAMLCLVAALFGRGDSVRRLRLRILRMPTLVAAGLAALAGVVEGVRVGAGIDLPQLHGAALFTVCLGVSAVSATLLWIVGRSIRSASPIDSRLRSSRWLEAPAVLALAAGTWGAIERDWFSIWAMWTLMLGFLTGMVLIAWRLRSARTTLPPVWFLFVTAFVTAVVAWSPRDLRVEWFSLPLGAFLVAAGAMHLRSADAPSSAPERRTVQSWPRGWTGSAALLAPGIVTMMLASVVATFTDPLTWRAILVMVLALAAILVGASRRLAAPFLLGLIALPIENVFVFAVQIGRGIESMPWWITLAVVGAVLLIIGVTSERRIDGQGSVAARIRDLR